MKYKIFITLAAAFYLFVVALFWPIEKKILPVSNGPTVMSTGYATAEVLFSDTRLRVRIPSTAKLEEKGLAGVEILSDEEGMLWRYTKPRRVAFWMKGMLIPLDFIWIANGRIVSLTEQIQPPANAFSTDLPIIDPGVSVNGVLEVAAGYISRHSIHVGDAAEVMW